MITAEAINALMAQVKALTEQADSPEELYQVLMYTGEVVGQRAHEVLMSHTQGTRTYEWAAQVSNDARKITDMSERMIDWIDSEAV